MAAGHAQQIMQQRFGTIEFPLVPASAVLCEGTSPDATSQSVSGPAGYRNLIICEGFVTGRMQANE
jgi:hypothetical protein